MKQISKDLIILRIFRKELFVTFMCTLYVVGGTMTEKDPSEDDLGPDSNKEHLLDVEEIKAFFKRVNSNPSAKQIEENQGQGVHDTRKSRRTIFQGTEGVAAAAGGLLPAILGTTNGNLINAAGTILAAAAASQAAAIQQAQQPGAVITSMSPAQQILQSRSCPGFPSAVCAPAGQCLLAGGVSVGSCAMGLLVCCMQRQEIPHACTPTNNLVTLKGEKLSTITSVDGTGRFCQFEIYKADETFCQLQLDFDQFELDPPLWGEDCSTDSSMTISDSVTVKNGFPLCGIHNGTRMYLSYGRSSRITISFTAGSKNSYRIRIKQIECKSLERVPDQCLQNHEGISGLVKSFGFPQYMINNQKYTVCINSKVVADQGKITWRECSIDEADSDSEQNFLLSEYFISDVPLDSPNETEMYYNYFNYYNSADTNLFIPTEGFSCLRTSYVEIHGEDKHCGAKFISSAKYIRSESRPYMLHVNVVEDRSSNLPDFALYRIPGLQRTSTGGLTDPLPENDCEHTSVNDTSGPILKPSSQGFDPCKIITKDKTGTVQYDLCLCTKKVQSTIKDKPKSRPDVLERKGFCIHYVVT